MKEININTQSLIKDAFDAGRLSVINAIEEYIETEAKAYQIAFCSDFLKWYTEKRSNKE